MTKVFFPPVSIASLDPSKIKNGSFIETSNKTLVIKVHSDLYIVVGPGDVSENGVGYNPRWYDAWGTPIRVLPKGATITIEV